MKKLLSLLLNTPAVSTYEKVLGISAIVSQKLNKFVPAEIEADGSVIARTGKKRQRPTVLISAHLDEVGFFISKKLTKDQYRILPLGEIEIKRIINSQVNLGMIKSNVVKPVSYDQIYLQTDKGGFNLLEPVYWLRKINFKESLVTAPALDNKVGATALVLLAGKLLKNKKYNFIFAAVAQEETGGKSFQSLVTQLNPDLIIDLDSAYAQKKPNQAATNIPVVGQGASLQVVGSGLNYEKSWLAEVLNRLKKSKIKFQLEIPLPNEGGTLLSQTDYCGKFLQVNIPVAYQHEPQSLADIKDITSCINLVEYLLR